MELDRPNRGQRHTSDSLTNCGRCSNVAGMKDAKRGQTCRPFVPAWTELSRFGTPGRTSRSRQMTPSRWTQKVITHARPPLRSPVHLRHHLRCSYQHRTSTPYSPLSLHSPRFRPQMLLGRPSPRETPATKISYPLIRVSCVVTMGGAWRLRACGRQSFLVLSDRSIQKGLTPMRGAKCRLRFYLLSGHIVKCYFPIYRHNSMFNWQ